MERDHTGISSQAHLVMTIKERGSTQAALVAWEMAERLRAEGH